MITPLLAVAMAIPLVPGAPDPVQAQTAPLEPAVRMSMVDGYTPPVPPPDLLTWNATVVNVVDGDTIEVTVGSETAITTIRVAGLNTNERYREAGGVPECHAEAASSRMKEILDTGDRVVLKAQSASSVSLGRPIRHVFFKNENVATPMLEDGLAVPIRFPEEPDFFEENVAAAHRAALTGEGLWNPDACGVGPAAGAVIDMVTNYDAAGVDEDNPNGEWVQLRNRGTDDIDLDGWVMRDSGLLRWSFPSSAELPAGGMIRIHMGSGTDTATKLYMGNPTAFMSNTSSGIYIHDTDFDIRAYDSWPCSGTCGQVGSLVIDKVTYDAPGSDTTNPNGEWIRIRNVGTQTVDLQDWMFETPPYQATSVASRPIAPGGTLTMFMGTGTNTASTMYWGKSEGVLSNTGDIVWLWTPDRDLADCAAWGNEQCERASIGSSVDLTVNYDAAGDDTANPNGEWVNLTNLSSEPVGLKDFELSSPPYRYSFPASTSILPGARLRVYIGSGTNTSTAKYWGRPAGILDNGGDIVSLIDPTGRAVRSFDYPCPGNCGPAPEPLVIDAVNENAPGDDTANPNGEWIRIRNVSKSVVDLRDWQITSGSSQLNPAASRKMQPGSVVTVYVGRGTNTSTRIYWQKSAGILNNSGGSVSLLSPSRDLADCSRWGSGTCPSGSSLSAALDVTVNFDAEGADLDNPNGEWVNLTNRSTRDIDITGATISSPGHLYKIEGTTILAPDEQLRLYIGSGSESRLVRHWGIGYGILGNTEDFVTVTTANGREIRTLAWPCIAGCGTISDLEIDDVNYDADGVDETNPNGEWVTIRNAGNDAVDLRNWTIFSSPYVYDFDSSTIIGPGEVLTLRIGSGSESRLSRYWGKSTGVLANGGDSVSLVSPTNDTVDCVAWGSVSC